MKLSPFYIAMLIVLLSQACRNKKDNCNSTIAFHNTSSSPIYVISTHNYPDTFSFRLGPSPEFNKHYKKIEANETNTQALAHRGECIESAFRSFSDTLMVFVFDAEVIETVPWDTVVANYLVLKRYDLTLQDLQDRNWWLRYP